MTVQERINNRKPTLAKWMASDEPVERVGFGEESGQFTSGREEGRVQETDANK